MKVIDTVYMIMLPKAKGDGVVYHVMGKSAVEAWANFDDIRLDGDRIMGTNFTSEIARHQGYRARKVVICLEDE
jgi:hypothetical protein